MHVIFVPYAIMKIDPASWLKMVTRFKGEYIYMISKNTVLSVIAG